MNDLNEARGEMIGNLSRISEFWGYPRAMGGLASGLEVSVLKKTRASVEPGELTGAGLGR